MVVTRQVKRAFKYRFVEAGEDGPRAGRFALRRQHLIRTFGGEVEALQPVADRADVGEIEGGLPRLERLIQGDGGKLAVRVQRDGAGQRAVADDEPGVFDADLPRVQLDSGGGGDDVELDA